MFDRPHSVYVEGLVEIFVLVTKKDTNFDKLNQRTICFAQ
jgi:hypothetical protein